MNEAGLEKLQRKVDGLSSLIEVSHIINSTLDLPELLDRIMEMAKRVMSAEASSLMLINENGDLTYAVATGIVGDKVKERGYLKMGEGIAGWVASHEQPLNIQDAYSDTRFDPSWDKQTGFRTRSVLCVPLRSRNNTIGVASVYNKIADGESCPFDDDDIALFSTYCDQSAIAIENARLHQAALERERLERDLALATRIQESFLPQEFPDVSGYTFFALNKPSEYVGGDLYDIFEIEPGRIVFSVGDVSGKGVSAALYMARLVSDFRILAVDARDSLDLATRINDILAQRSSLGMFVTMFEGYLNTRTGGIEFTNAGHPPAVIRRASGDYEHIRKPSGPPLGIFETITYTQGNIRLAPGDTVVIYTDGITEAMRADGQMFGLERFEALLREPFDEPTDLAARIVEQVLNFARDGRRMDDLTMMIIKRR